MATKPRSIKGVRAPAKKVVRKDTAPKGPSASRTRGRQPLFRKAARKYQVLTVNHGLKAPKCGILLDPGMGKTGCVLQIAYELSQRHMFKGAWVVSTLRGANEVWGLGPANERDKWQFPFTAALVHGTKKVDAMNADVDLRIINWDGLDWLAQNWTDVKRTGDMLVIDESTKGKNHGAQRSKALKFLCQYFKRIIILTGTPTPRSMMDLWGQIYYLDGGQALGKYITNFRAKYFEPGKRIRNPHKAAMLARGVPRHRVPDFITTEWELIEGGEEAIYKAVDHLVIRFSDKMLGLKEPVYQNIYFELPPAAMDRYLEAEEESVMLDDDGKVVTHNAGARTIRQRQIASGAVYVDATAKTRKGHRDYETVHAEKIEILKDLIEELQGKPLLVGFEFTHERERLVAALPKGTPFIDGSVSVKDGSRIMAEFNAGEHVVLLAQMASVAHAVNLQAICHHVCYFAMTYDLEVYIQFMKRVLRQGQKNIVHIYHLMARDTVDEDMYAMLSTKDANQKSLLRRFELAARARLKRMVWVRGKRALRP